MNRLSIKHYVTGIMALLVMVSCGEKEQTDKVAYKQLEASSWLLGSWSNQLKNGELLEIWSRENDSCFSAVVYHIKEKDTAEVERITIIETNSDLFYIPEVKAQNEGKKIRFKRINDAERMLQFENKEHDFPQRISYSQLSKDSIIAEISGLRNGNFESRSFPMRKK